VKVRKAREVSILITQMQVEIQDKRKRNDKREEKRKDEKETKKKQNINIIVKT